MSNKFKSEKEYAEYLKNQYENAEELETKDIAMKIFDTNNPNYKEQIFSLLNNNNFEQIDIFNIMLEITLYGFQYIPILNKYKKTIFDIITDNDEVIDLINRYVKTIGYKLIVTQIMEYDNEKPNDYKTWADYYCEINEKL